MKWVAWLLVLVNGLLFGYFQMVAPHQQESALRQDIQPEKIRILSAAELAAMAQPKVAEPAAALPAMTVPAPDVCYEWGSFSAQDATHAKEALDRLALSVTTKKHTRQEAIRYWVYIPPLKTPEAAQTKVDEVRALGVEETFIIQDPKWRNAVSLGVFRDETLADRFLEDLRARGVRSAIKGQRNLEGEQTGYQIRNMTAQQQEAVNQLKPDFPGSDLKLVECK